MINKIFLQAVVDRSLAMWQNYNPTEHIYMLFVAALDLLVAMPDADMNPNNCGPCNLLKFDSQMECYCCGHSHRAEDVCPLPDATDEHSPAHGEGCLEVAGSGRARVFQALNADYSELEARVAAYHGLVILDDGSIDEASYKTLKHIMETTPEFVAVVGSGPSPEDYKIARAICATKAGVVLPFTCHGTTTGRINSQHPNRNNKPKECLHPECYVLTAHKSGYCSKECKVDNRRRLNDYTKRT